MPGKHRKTQGLETVLVRPGAEVQDQERCSEPSKDGELGHDADAGIPHGGTGEIDRVYKKCEGMELQTNHAGPRGTE